MKTPTIEMLKKVPVFSRLTNEELGILLEHMALLKFNKGKILFNEGDKGDYVCFVVNGRLDVIKRTFTNDEFILNTLSRGQSFGEMSIIESSPRSATVKANTDVEIVRLSQGDFDAILKEHPGIGTKILKGVSLLLSRKLRQTSSRLIGYMSKELQAG